MTSWGVMLSVCLVGCLPSSDSTAEPTPLLLTVGDALRFAVQRNPELMDARDSLSSAQWNERGVASTFLPRVTPFYSTDQNRIAGGRTENYGISASELFPWGTFVEGNAGVTRSPLSSPDSPYASDYRLTLSQPLLRGADPAATREPLRQAKRSVLAEARSVEVSLRRTVLTVYQSYLGLARQIEAGRIAAEHVDRAKQLTEFSLSRFSAGSISRLDVLRAEQQEASAAVARNDAENLIEDFRDALRRAAGLPANLEFGITAPSGLPVEEAPLSEALAELPERRPEALEARDQITDARFAVRIAKSLELPSLIGVLTYEAGTTGVSAGSVLRPRNPALLFGLRSEYGLNLGLLHSQRRRAEIALETRTRDERLLEEDMARDVQRVYRRLDGLRRNHDIAVNNVRVAEVQAEVAQLRFEKGLSDNFNVVDAENLLNGARLLELESRFAILLAQLECLYFSGRLELQPFLRQP